MVKLLDFPSPKIHTQRVAARRTRQRFFNSQQGEVALAQTNASAMEHKPIEWHWIWRETCNRLDAYQLLVGEGRELEAALTFARFVIWSRLDRLMAEHDNPGLLKVDSSLMVWKARELQRTVQEAYRTGKASPAASEGLLQAIQRKLDIIAAHVSTKPGKG